MTITKEIATRDLTGELLPKRQEDMTLDRKFLRQYFTNSFESYVGVTQRCVHMAQLLLFCFFWRTRSKIQRVSL